ncbi:MAG: clostripain-related cysteine peptidase, partial [Anaerolineae bacterium]
MTPTTPPPDWAVLCYLCGDHPALEAQIETQLQQLVRAGASKQLAVAVQRDRRAGAERFILRKRGAKTLPKPAQTLGAASTGDPDILADFLRWGLETCPARQVAVFISGLGIAHSRSVTGIAAPEEGDLFTFADDATAGDALDPFKLNQALDSALSDGERSRLELLVFDAQAVQFIELAHQLAGRVTMLVGPQLETTGAVWDYTRLIRAWKKSLRQGQTGSRQLARLAVETAQAADAAGVSALDLSRLDTVTRAFDGLTQALLQSLGDDIIWDVVWDEAAQVAFNVAPPAGQGFLEAN